MNSVFKIIKEPICIFNKKGEIINQTETFSDLIKKTFDPNSVDTIHRLFEIDLLKVLNENDKIVNIPGITAKDYWGNSFNASLSIISENDLYYMNIQKMRDSKYIDTRIELQNIKNQIIDFIYTTPILFFKITKFGIFNFCEGNLLSLLNGNNHEELIGKCIYDFEFFQSHKDSFENVLNGNCATFLHELDHRNFITLLSPNRTNDTITNIMGITCELITTELSTQKQIPFLSNKSSNIIPILIDEIKKPVFNLMHCIQTLKTSNKKINITELEESALSLLTVMNDIIDISKIDSGEMILKENTVNLKNILNKSCKVANLKKPDIKIKCSFANDLPDIITDSRLFQQVIVGLLICSSQFSSNNILFRVEKVKVIEKESYFVLEISNKNFLDNQTLFLPWEQIQQELFKNFKGSIMNLTSCNKIIELMNGKLFIDNNLSFGIVFKLYIKFTRSIGNYIETPEKQKIGFMKLKFKKLKN